MRSTDKILRVVIDFLEVHDQLEGKYWPMVDVFVERLAQGIPERKIAGAFHRAYRQAKGLKPEDHLPSYWYKIVNQIQHMAAKGRAWIKEHTDKGVGFWNMLELAEVEQISRRKLRMKKASAVNNKYYRYFLEDGPAEFPFLCAVFLEDKRLPDLGKEQKEWELYERLCVRMLNILLNDSTFFFNPKHNWPGICQRILGQIKPSQFPVILDITTKEAETSEPEESKSQPQAVDHGEDKIIDAIAAMWRAYSGRTVRLDLFRRLIVAAIGIPGTLSIIKSALGRFQPQNGQSEVVIRSRNKSGAADFLGLRC